MQNSLKTSAKNDVGLAQNDVMTFNSAEFGKVRTVIIDRTPWFVGRDVASSLGYAKPENAISNHVDEEDKTSTLIQGNGSNYKSRTIIINESGVYALVFGSKLESAKKFKHWVTSEVLPSIRKTGGYAVPRTFGEALQLAANQQVLLESQKPKVEFYDTVMGMEESFPMDKVAKILELGYGRNILFKRLREAGILQANNVPYQRYVNAGYFNVIENIFEDRNGNPHITTTTRVYQKGVDYIRKLMKGESSAEQ